MKIYQDLLDKKAKLAVIGLGYVGLPIALEFAKRLSVIGFDINQKRINLMRKNSYYGTPKFKCSLILFVIFFSGTLALLYFTVTECFEECR
mgnify:CR=1 FL=1